LKTLKWISAAITLLLGLALCQDLAGQIKDAHPGQTGFCEVAGSNPAEYVPIASGVANASSPPATTDAHPGITVFGYYAAGSNYQLAGRGLRLVQAGKLMMMQWLVLMSDHGERNK
jgi:hypothetical protein